MSEVPTWALTQFGDDGVARVEASIAEAESHTSGEIVPILVRRSSTVGHVPMLSFTLLLLCVWLGDLPFRLDAWLGGPHWLSLGLAWLLAGGMAVVLSRFDAVQRALTPRLDQAQQVGMRAEVEFYEHGIGQTEGSTGILLFVSLMEHRAVVLADRAIAEKLGADVWQEVVDLLIEGVKRKDLADGMSTAIQRCGELLNPHFPISPDDANELRDHLVIKE